MNQMLLLAQHSDKGCRGASVCVCVHTGKASVCVCVCVVSRGGASVCVCVCGIKGRAGKNAWNALTPEGASIFYRLEPAGHREAIKIITKVKSYQMAHHRTLCVCVCVWYQGEGGEGIENGELNTRRRIGKRLNNPSAFVHECVNKARKKLLPDRRH